MKIYTLSIQLLDAVLMHSEDLNSFPIGDLEETTRTPLYYVNEDCPATPEIQ